MTTVKLLRKNRSIISVHCSGHTGYDDNGYDIICAALSSIVQTTALGLMQVLGLQISFNKDDEKANLCFELPELQPDKRHEADILLDTMLLGLDNLSDTYSDFVELLVIDN